MFVLPFLKQTVKNMSKFNIKLEKKYALHLIIMDKVALLGVI